MIFIITINKTITKALFDLIIVSCRQMLCRRSLVRGDGRAGCCEHQV